MVDSVTGDGGIDEVMLGRRMNLISWKFRIAASKKQKGMIREWFKNTAMSSSRSDVVTQSIHS